MEKIFSKIKKLDSGMLFMVFVLVVIVITFGQVIAIESNKYFRQPEEITHYIEHDDTTYYFNEYYINNSNEICFDTYWKQNAFDWQKIDQTTKIPLIDLIIEIEK